MNNVIPGKTTKKKKVEKKSIAKKPIEKNETHFFKRQGRKSQKNKK